MATTQIKIPKKDVLFILTGKNGNDGNSDVITSIPFIDVINWKDEKTGDIIERKIRYIKGASSIFADEQREDYNDAWERKNMKPKSLRVYNNMHRVKSTETLLMQFMWACNFNGSNPSRKDSVDNLFYVYDAEAIATANNKVRDRRIEAEGRVKAMDVNELRAHLITSFSGATMDSINVYRNMEEEQLRDTAYSLAAKNPDAFLKTFESPSTASKYIVLNAILRGIITFNEQSNTISWAESKDVIMSAANGMNSIDALAEFSITSEKYKAVVDDLKNRMLDRMGSREKAVSNTPDVKTDSRDAYDFTIDKCIEAGIIVNKFPWFLINNSEKDSKDKEPLKFQGNKKLKEYLKTHREEYFDLLDRLDKATVTA